MRSTTFQALSGLHVADLPEPLDSHGSILCQLNSSVAKAHAGLLASRGDSLRLGGHDAILRNTLMGLAASFAV